VRQPAGMADDHRTTGSRTTPADGADLDAASQLVDAVVGGGPDASPGDEDRSRAAPIRAWLRATPAEQVGLTMLLAGAMLATGLVWWGSLVRADGTVAATGSEAAPGSGQASTDAAHVGLSVDADTPDGGHDTDGHVAPDPGPDGSAVHPTGPSSGQPAATDGVGSGWVMVHVSGAVGAPGLVTLPTGSRVDDAVNAAGGMLVDGDPAAINLARPLDDGEHVHVPVVGEPPVGAPTGPPSTGEGSSSGTSGPVDLNRASVEELQTLPGIGPAKAAAIVEHRQTVGPFAVPGDLRGVPGIGEKTFQALADRVVVR
jgi:competence protein ComEA